MDEIRRLMADMEAEERELLQARTMEADTRVFLTLTMLVLATCFVLVFSFVRRIVTERACVGITTPTLAANQTDNCRDAPVKKLQKLAMGKHA